MFLLRNVDEIFHKRRKIDFDHTLDFTAKILEMIKMSGLVPNFINLSSEAVYKTPSNHIGFPEKILQQLKLLL
jgi:hypothetical protein